METKRCGRCKIEKPVIDFHRYKDGFQSWCKKCNSIYGREWDHRTGKCQPLNESKNSGSYLGVCIAEKVLSKYFENVVIMPYGNIGYDFICKNGYKIDVKSSCRNKKANRWYFNIDKNHIADYFILIAFDDRNSLQPKHIWIIPGNDICDRVFISMRNSEAVLQKWKQYEKPIDKIITCCNKMREGV